MFHEINWDALRDGPERKKMSTQMLYSQSKYVSSLIDPRFFSSFSTKRLLRIVLLFFAFVQGNVVFAKELARRYGDQGIVSIAVNPGNLATDLQRHGSKFKQFLTVSRPSHLPSYTLIRLTYRYSQQHTVFSFPAPMGALTQLWGGTMPETAEYNGKVSVIF